MLRLYLKGVSSVIRNANNIVHRGIDIIEPRTATYGRTV